MRKAVEREQEFEQSRLVDTLLNQTGIRTLRRKPVFTTPNVFAPDGFQPCDSETDAPVRQESIEPQNCYICKEDYSTIHHFYDQLCPACAELNLRKRTELADLRGRVALLTGGRVKIGYQAGIKLLRPAPQLIVTTRFPRDSAAVMRRNRISANGGSPGNLRTRLAPHTERRGVLPASA